MKATGIIRRIDDLGRVVIPKEVRKKLGFKIGDPFEIFVGDDGEIILKKYYSDDVCLICGATEDVREVKGKYICVGCCKAALEEQA